MSKFNIRRSFITVTIIIVVYLIGILGVMLYVRSQASVTLYTFKESQNQDNLDRLPNGGEQFFVENEEGNKLDLLYYDVQSSDQILLYFHGNAGRTAALMQDVVDAEFIDMISPAYPGYSRSEGEPNEELIYETVDLAIQYITEELGYEMDDIIVLGHSMGGTPALYTAVNYDVKATITLNTYTMVKDLCEMDYGILCSLVTLHDNTSLARSAKGIIFQYHAPADLKVPYSQGVRLSEVLQSNSAVTTELLDSPAKEGGFVANHSTIKIDGVDVFTMDLVEIITPAIELE